jgi:hypothetical protein
MKIIAHRRIGSNYFFNPEQSNPVLKAIFYLLVELHLAIIKMMQQPGKDYSKFFGYKLAFCGCH